jgi:hypothetical protein
VTVGLAMNGWQRIFYRADWPAYFRMLDRIDPSYRT